jgi:HAD superfamily hydrolase (TIGR01450 family)
MRRFKSIIFDIDGVIWIDGAPAQGAPELLDYLYHRNVPFCLLTNGCNISTNERHQELTGAGFRLRADQVVTASDVTQDWLLQNGVGSIIYLGSPNAGNDLARSVTIKATYPVDAVVVGDLFDFYSRNMLQEAAKAIDFGATLIAMQNNKQWWDGKKWSIDNGFWVAGLEFVTGRQAVITGKPSLHAYSVALQRVDKTGICSLDTLFVSDDINIDLKGANGAGLGTVYIGPPQELPSWIDANFSDLATLQQMMVGAFDE